MKKTALIIWLVVLTFSVQGQELFPLNEPASTLPKGTLGIRPVAESYKEFSQIRNLFGLRLMYGLTPRLTLIVMANASNHHNTALPADFPIHNTPERGKKYPYLFNGVYLYGKYRFFSHDGQNSHLRIAAYAEASTMNTAHDEAEPTLTDDTKGIGAGFITTYLKNHLAISFNTGIIVPFAYKGSVPDLVPSLPSAPARLRYGNAWTYNLSFGYLVYPNRYKNYNQTNWNLYVEFLGKMYQGVDVHLTNIGTGTDYYVPTGSNRALRGDHYVEVHPGIQCIVRSNLRIDLSVGYPLIRESYVHLYPVYTFGIQRYFYPGQKKAKR